MDSTYVTLSYGNHESAFLSEGGSCPKIEYEVFQDPGTELLLWVETDPTEPFDSLAFNPGLDTNIGTFNNYLRATYDSIFTTTGSLLLVTEKTLIFDIRNSCLQPTLTWNAGTDSYDFFARNTLTLDQNQS